MISVKSTVASCLDLGAPLSIKKHVLGVLAGHNIGGTPYFQVRSLRQRLDLIRNKPFVKVAVVTVWPDGSDQVAPYGLQEDLDTANAIYQQWCEVWIYFTSLSVIHTDQFGPSVTVDSDSSQPTDDELALHELGGGIQAPVIGYYVGRLTSASGRGSSDLRAFWLGRTPPPFGQPRKYIFTHELGHVVGSLGHLCEEQGHDDDRSNIMCTRPSWGQGPTFDQDQCESILNDPDVRTFQ